MGVGRGVGSGLSRPPHTYLLFPPRSLNASDYQVHLGQLTITLSPHFSTVRQIHLYSGHPGAPGSSGDIALLQLSTPVTLSSRVLPICLPEASADFPPGTPCWVTGWGYTREGGEESPQPPWGWRQAGLAQGGAGRDGASQLRLPR